MCNAYFAQLAVEKVGPMQLFETAKLLGIRVATPNTPERLQRMLAQAGYGQGEVLASPLQIARLAATIANGGVEVEVRLTAKRDGRRLRIYLACCRPRRLTPWRGPCVSWSLTEPWVTRALPSPVPIAGKTGTAEVVGAPFYTRGLQVFAPGEHQPPGGESRFRCLSKTGSMGDRSQRRLRPSLSPRLS